MNTSKAVISGIGEVQPVRYTGSTVEKLILTAIDAALVEAGIEAKDIGAVITEGKMIPQSAPFDRIAPMAGLQHVQPQQTSPAGAGILAAVGRAFDIIENGDAEHALVYFGVDWGTTPEGPTDYHASMGIKNLVESATGYSGPALYFATIAQRYQYLYDLSDEQMQELLWQVVEATRANAASHPNAQQRKALSKNEYLEKPMIAVPLRSVDCSLLSDAAVALVVSRKDSYKSKKHPVALAGWAYDYDQIADMDFYTLSPWLPDIPAATRSSAKALQQADLKVSELDMFMLYDCFTIAVILQLEAIGVCERGQSLAFSANQALRYDGTSPTNTHGGLLAHGYLMGAGHVVEAIKQLRHDAGDRQVASAKTAFVGAGPGRQYTSLIFQREES